MASPRTDDNAIMKHILATHSPDGTNFDVMPLLQIIEDMHRADPYASHQANQAEMEVTVEGVISNDVSATLQVMALTINKVSCEISYKCIGGEDPYGTTIGIFNMLSKYRWDAKATITLAAFAVIYGEFWLVARHYTDNPLAKSLVLLKRLPAVLEHEETFKPRFDAISMLITAILDLTHCIVGFKEIPEEYISSETPELVIATTHIPRAVYWIIRSIVACASTLVNLTGMGHKRITMIDEAWELSSFVPMISNIRDRLLHQFDLQNQHINEKKQIEAYQMIIRIMDTPHLDNLKPLKHLIYLKDDLLPLYKSSTKKLVGV
ncbi:sieve element occlusion B-like protein [Tanacetum coccineum]